MSFKKHIPWSAALVLTVAVMGVAFGQASAPIAPGESRLQLPDPDIAPPPTAAPVIQPDIDDVATGTTLRSIIAREVPGSADDISITVAGKVATIRGSVPTLYVRDRIAEAARTLRGIERVDNKLAVAGPDRDDEAILRDVNAILANDPVAGPLRVGVAVTEGAVSLSGEVDRWQTQEYVSSLVKSVPGVRAINSRLSFTTSEQPDDRIAALIQQRLNEDAWVDPGLMRVSVTNGQVALTGTVGSAFERNRAITDAWVEGVKSVNAEGLRVDVGMRREMLRAEDSRQPTDQQIRGALSNSFSYGDNPRLLGTDPEIHVRDGVVTLSGVVDTAEAARAAEDVAQSVYGVRSVVNRLQVRSGGAAAPSGAGDTGTAPMDSDVAGADARTTRTADSKEVPEGDVPPLVADFRNAIDKDPTLKTVQVSASDEEDGFYLYGIVDTEAKRNRAEQIAASLPGVDKVINKIRVSQDWQVTESGMRPSDEQIRQGTEEAIAWSPYIDPGSVNVSVNKGVATLEGSVNNWRDSMLAARAATLAGATSVQNNLQVGVTASEEEAQAAAAAAAPAAGGVQVVTQSPGAAGAQAPGAAPVAAAPGAPGMAPAPGRNIAYDDNGMEIAVVPGAGGIAVVPGGIAGSPGAQQNGDGVAENTNLGPQPRNIPVGEDTTTGRPGAPAPGAAGVPGAGGSDPNIAAVPGAGGLTAPGADQVTNRGSAGLPAGSGSGATAPPPATTPPPAAPPAAPPPVPAPTTGSGGATGGGGGATGGGAAGAGGGGAAGGGR